MSQLEILRQGGPVLWMILACSVFGVYLILERMLHLRRATIVSPAFLSGISNVLGRGNIEEAISICEDTPGPVAYITRAAILNYDESEETMRHAVQAAGFSEIPRLEHNLNTLLALAHITPILGLLGTVLGLMDFLVVVQQTSPLIQAADLTGGMWKALFTTAAGLGAAIPLYALHALLTGKVQAAILEMERAGAEVMHLLLSRKGQPRGVPNETNGRPA